MPIQGKWFNTLIVSGSRGSIQVDSSAFVIHTDTLEEQGNLQKTNTFIEDLEELLRVIDGVSDARQHTKDMLKNLKVAMYAERSALEHTTLIID